MTSKDYNHGQKMLRQPLTLSVPRATPCNSGVAGAEPPVGLRRTHERIFLEAEMKAGVLGYQMSTKSNRESEK